MKIYIYKLEELDGIMEYFYDPPTEMNLHSLYHYNLTKNYEIVDRIGDCDLAFIPIDFTKLFFGHVKENKWIELYTILLEKSTPVLPTPTGQPPTLGVDHKENHMKFFWENYVKQHLKLESKKPHFLLYSYVLFEISFDPIPKEIFILSYENQVSIQNTIQTLRLGTQSRVIPIPYILNSNPSYSLSKIDGFYDCKKEYEVSFIGNFKDKNRPLLTKFRKFVKYFGNKIHSSDTTKIQETIQKSKYNLVLRGDTPTRMSFYQCFAYGTIPIVFESEMKIYNQLSTSEFTIDDSCLVIPDKNNMGDREYYEVVDQILTEELSDNQNYLNRVQNHRKIFDNFNYFSQECLPIKNSLEKVLGLS
jgi:hypothetical protein